MTVYNTNASIVTSDRMGETFKDKYSRKSKLYEVYCKGCKSQGLKDGMIITPFEPEDKKMYCFTIESGMLLLRRNDRVFVTGNSGKDCSKVDRSAAYYCRYVAKNIVAAGLARKCEIQVAYAIGVAKPVSLYVDAFGTDKIPDEEIKDIILKFFNFQPLAIRTEIINDDVCFQVLAEYGHVGREDVDVPWERTNKAYILKAYVRQAYGKATKHSD